MSKSLEKDRRSVKRLRPEEIEAVIINTVFEDLLEHGFAQSPLNPSLPKRV
jgi:hypothetical protein